MGHGQVEYKYLISSTAGNIIRRHVRKSFPIIVFIPRTIVQFNLIILIIGY